MVIDANVGLAQLISLPYSERAVQSLGSWRSEKVRLVVPTFWWYEVLTGLRRAVVEGLLPRDQAREAMEQMAMINIEEVAPSTELNRSAFMWAERLVHSKTCDAHYLALAGEMGVEFWTADERLVKGARQAGVGWVRWVMEPV